MAAPNAPASIAHVSDQSSASARAGMRFVIATLLAGIAFLLLRGADAALVPAWLIRLAELSPEAAATVYRVQIAAVAAAGGLCLTTHRWWKVAAAVALAWLLFTDVASWSSGGTHSAILVRPSAPLWVSVPLLAGLLILTLSTPIRIPSRRLLISPAWRLMGVLCVLVIASAIGGRANVRAMNPDRVQSFRSTGSMVRLEIHDWHGRFLEQTPLFDAIPELESLPTVATRFVVLIHPGCARCLEIFDLYYVEFAAADVVVINLEPPNPDSGEPGVAELFPTARQFTLPSDRLWISPSPAVLRLDEGVIRCTAAENLDPCVSDAQAR